MPKGSYGPLFILSALTKSTTVRNNTSFISNIMLTLSSVEDKINHFRNIKEWTNVDYSDMVDTCLKLR